MAKENIMNVLAFFCCNGHLRELHHIQQRPANVIVYCVEMQPKKKQPIVIFIID